MAPGRAPPRSRPITCPPRVTNQVPLAGVTPASDIPWTRASALAPMRSASAASSAVESPAASRRTPSRCTTPRSGASPPGALKNDRHEARRPSAGPASTSCPRLRSSASRAAGNAPVPASTKRPRSACTCDGPRARISSAPDGSSSRDVPPNPASARARLQTEGPTSAWSERYASRKRHQPGSSPKVRSSHSLAAASSTATSTPDGASRRRQWASVSPRSRVACSTFAAITRS